MFVINDYNNASLNSNERKKQGISSFDSKTGYSLAMMFIVENHGFLTLSPKLRGNSILHELLSYGTEVWKIIYFLVSLFLFQMYKTNRF